MHAYWHEIKAMSARYRFALIFVLLCCGIAAGGIIYFRHYERNDRAEVERRLTAIAELKARELANWREGHEIVANVFQNNTTFAALIQRFFDNPQDMEARAQIQAWINPYQVYHQYFRIFLMDTKGVIRLSANGAPPMDALHFARETAASLASGQIVFIDLHRDEPLGLVHITVVVPIRDQNNDNQPVGVLALYVNPDTYLYPFLKHWPEPSQTAETLLVRREGNDAVFLNELRLQTNTARNLRISVTNINVVSVKAVLGQAGIAAGTDYYGAKVIADLRRVPDSPWFLVTQIHTAEAEALLRRGRWIVTMVVIVLILGTGTIIILVGQRNTKAQLAAEKERNQSEGKYRRLIENSHDIIYTISSDGIFTFVSPAVTALLGYSADQVVGQSLRQFIHPDDFARGAEFLQALFEKGQRHADSECRMRHADGSWRWYTSSAVPLRNEDGAIIGCEGIAKDCTERRRAEEQAHALLAESNQSRTAMMNALAYQARTAIDLKRLAMAIEQAAEIIVITDGQGLIQYVNPAFETVTGYTSKEVVGRNSNILKSGRQAAAFYRALWETIRSGKIWSGRFVNRNKNGALYTEEATISPVRDADGTIVNYVAVKRDITAELDIQAQLNQAQKMEAVGCLAGGMAHDFNNILQVMMGNVELTLAQMKPDDPLRPDLEEVKNAGKRAVDLIRQLLGFARKQTIAPRALDLNKTVEDMLNMLRRLIGENIEVLWTPQEGLWTIKIDPVQVDQILVNLCVNARDAIAGIGTVRIATANIRIDKSHAARHDGVATGDYVLLTVSDTGCGMDKQTQEKIFEPFFTTKMLGKDTGLGLATVYGIVQQNQGQISVYSEPGMGATLKIYLPRHIGDNAAPVAEIPAQALAHGKGKLLLVEDDAALLGMGNQMLQKFGYTVLMANTPERALCLAEEHADDIQLLVTDIVMPGMNGKELAARLKARYPKLKCLFMSGFTMDIIAHQGILDESCYFIQKPFSMQDLAAKVMEVLNGAPDTLKSADQQHAGD